MIQQRGYGVLTVTDVTDGINTATIYLYQRTIASSPIVPTGTFVYTFSNGNLTGGSLNGWKRSIAECANNTGPLWVITANVNSPDPTVEVSNWSVPVKLAEDGDSIKEARELYYFKSTSDSLPQPISSETTIYEDTNSGHWTSKVPAYSAGGTYYTCIETLLTDNTTKTWSVPVENRALTDSNYNALVAKSIAEHNEENAQGALSISRATQQHFWFNTTTQGNLLSGAYITDTAIDTFKNEKSGGYLLARSDGLEFGKGSNKFIDILAQGANTDALTFYDPTHHRPVMILNGSSLTFKEPNSDTIAATLDGHGLNIIAGSINLGNGNFEATYEGSITAKNGTIGGWSINSTYGIYTNSKTNATSTNTGILIHKDGAIYAGAYNSSSGACPFQVTSGGALTAISGRIGKFNLSNTYLYTGTGSTQAGMGGDQAFWAGSSTSSSAPFRVSYGGQLNVTGAKISGDIVAQTLRIGSDTTNITTSAILNVNVQPQNFSEGTMLYKDPMFIYGNNSTYLYDNNHSGKTNWTRVAKSSDNPENKTSYEMVCTNTGAGPSPGLGGFYWSHSTRINAVFLYRIIAKIPTGYTLQFASNATGNNTTRVWLTPNVGTGQFKEYIFKLGCGSSGTFSTSGFFYLDGTAPVTWYVAYAAVFDMTGKAEVNNYITNVDTNGIWITPADKAPTNTSTGAGATGTKIDGNGVGIYIGGIKVAQYGSTTTFYTSDGKTAAATLNGTGLNIAAGTITLGSNNFVATNTGAVTAKNITVAGGTIGGFTITSTSNTGTSASGGHAYTTSLYAHSGDGTYEYEVGMKGDGNNTTGDSGNVAFYVRRISKGGQWSSAAYPFYVTKGGTLYAESVDIKGKVAATSGSFSGTVTASVLKTGSKTAYNSGNGTYIDSSGNIYVGNGSTNNFTVTAAGTLTATGANVTGTIIATSFVAKNGSTVTATFGSSINLGSNGAAVTIGQVAANKYNTYITTSGMDVRNNTTSIAHFGDTARIGATSSYNIQVGTSSIDFYKNGTNYCKIESTTSGTMLGYYGVSSGTATYGNWMYFGASSSPYIHFIVGNGSSNSRFLYLESNAYWKGGHFVLDNNHSFRGIATTGAEVPMLWVSGSDTINLGSSSYAVYVNSKTFSGNKSYSTSDLRLKRDIKYLDSRSYDLIMRLKPFEFSWDRTVNESLADGKCFGLGAQDVNKAMIEAGYKTSDYGVVGKMPDGHYAVSYTELIPHLIKVAQEQQKEIEQLKKDIAELKNK